MSKARSGSRVSPARAATKKPRPATGRTSTAGASAGASTTRKTTKAGAKASSARPRPEAAETPRQRDPQHHRASRAAAEAAIDAALDKKGLVPVLLDVSGKASYTDFIAIVSGRSDRQVDAISEGVTEAMAARGWRLIGREGSGNGRWTLLDFGDIVLHVFYHPVREFYDIEGLWIDAPRVDLKVPPEARHVHTDTFYESA